MKILVCITHVPDTTSKIQFTDNNTKFDKNGVQFIIGPYDDYALARAVELKEQLGEFDSAECRGSRNRTNFEKSFGNRGR
jgi:electron transfer flavoprotein alpha/beta subunit